MNGIGTCVFRLWERDWRQGWPGKKGRLAKRWTKCTGPFDEEDSNEQLYRLTQTMLPELTTFLSFLSFSSSSSFFFFFLSSSFCTINLPAGRGQEMILFVLAHRRLIIEAKFPQITMKHGVINVRCVRDDRVIYTCRTHLATDWPCRVVRLRTLPLVRDRILNFTRFVSRLDLAAAFKFE